MKHLTIGRSSAGDFKLPPDFITRATAIMAQRGSGKSYLAAVVAEEVLDTGTPTVIIDPTGAHSGLKSSADGRSEGYPVVVFGGENADLPLEEGAGELIASAIVEKRFSAILDLSLLRKGARLRFLQVFLETLYHKNRETLYLICDEVDMYAPQKPFGDEARVLGAMEDIVRRGRRFGLGVALISQRPSVINKDVLTQCEVMVAMRISHPRDIEPINEWVMTHGVEEKVGDMKRSLPSLTTGTGWFWSPALKFFERVEVRRRRTFDSGATPEPGKAAVKPKKLAAVDVSKLGEEIKAISDKAKAENPEYLKRQIVELRRSVMYPVPPKVEVKEVSVLTDEDRKALSNVLTSVSEVCGILAPIMAKVKAFTQTEVRVPVMPPATLKKIERELATHRPSLTQGHPADNGTLTGGLRRMMIALAQRPGLDKKQLGVRAGLSSSSGTFGTYLGRMRSNGWVDGSESICLTKEGVSALGNYEPLPTGQGLLNYWVNEMSGGARRMLEVLAQAYPQSMTAAELGERAGISPDSGTFGTYLGKLRTLELITGDRNGLRASNELFD